MSHFAHKAKGNTNQKEKNKKRKMNQQPTSLCLLRWSSVIVLIFPSLTYLVLKQPSRVALSLWYNHKFTVPGGTWLIKAWTVSPSPTSKLWGSNQRLPRDSMQVSLTSSKITVLPLPTRGAISLPMSSARSFLSPSTRWCTTVAIRTSDPTRPPGYPTRKFSNSVVLIFQYLVLRGVKFI